VGGKSTPYNQSPVQVFDHAMNVWRKLAPVSPRYTSAGNAAYNNKLYIFGGETNLSQDPQNVYYEPATNGFIPQVGFPILALYPAANSIQNKIYIAGGITSGLYAIGNVYEFDPVANVMTQLPTRLQYPRVGACGVSVGDNFYVIGGTNFLNGSASGYNESIDIKNSRFYLLKKN
jgi:N-acetylneuraminic acid mutarotase